MWNVLASLLAPEALAIHARLERWAYDELPLPWRLFQDRVEQLCRNDRLREGTLRIGERRAALAGLRVPGITMMNRAGRVVPPASILAGLATAPHADFRTLDYAGDRGSMLQHLGPLVAPSAHQVLWPRIFDWVDGLGSRMG